MYALNSLNSYDYTASFSDPRLISSAHSGQRLLLDAPPMDGGVAMADVYACRPGYKMNYSNYSDIGGGDVSYYYDSAIGKPFISQLFGNSSRVGGDEKGFVKVNYIDPMGTLKPHYYRDESSSDKSRSTSSPCFALTWLEDSQRQRNDIMASQLWRRNQSDRLLMF